MTLVLDPRQATEIRQHGESDYPHEACGLMGGMADGERTIVTRLVPLANRRTDAAHNRYLIDPDAYLHAQRELDRDGIEIVGIYHSHPDHPARPSEFDREHAWPHLSYVIVSVVKGRAADMRSWRLSDDRDAFGEEPITLEQRKVAWQSKS
ncbi:MAG TPA: M67 family metallopeptidase [Gemmatimonadales bacterium]|nr:M67 family metallopeptidase [Gemmatimonadales bacterium]